MKICHKCGISMRNHPETCPGDSLFYSILLLLTTIAVIAASFYLS